ncbi:MAG: RNA polymerase sigma factor [Pseudomonadota bacterium]
MNEDSQQIISKAQRGDREAFRQVLQAHYGMIHRVAYRFTGHAVDAEDVTQEVCMALVDKLRSYNGRSSFSTWLYRVIVNQCHDFRKKRGADRARDTQYVELEAMGAADAVEANRKTAWLYRAIAALKPPLPETALLVLAEECSHAEAAIILNCKESTVSWRMHEVRKQLITLMEGGDV